MSKKLDKIAKDLVDNNKKVQLIYAFNGTGKTRLSNEFKNLVAPKSFTDDENDQPRDKFLYYNAFTEDLFYWDNDLDADTDPAPKLRVQPNSFTDWLITLLNDLGEEGNITTNFQRYTSNRVTPEFNQEYKIKKKDFNGKLIEITIPAYSEVTFKVADNSKEEVVTSNDDAVVEGKYETVKISKGEESNFVWSLIFTLLEQAVSELNEPDFTNRTTDKFDKLEYLFIDDPVSSLDDNHLIELAVDLASLVKSSKSGLKFIITTHSPLFYNVLSNELSNKSYDKQTDGSFKLAYNPNKVFRKYRLDKQADELFKLETQPTDSPFSYHLYLLSELQDALNKQQVRKYHFGFIRNILEKMATFLGYSYWPALLPKTAGGKPDPFFNRILNLSNHSAHAGEEVPIVEEKDKEDLKELVTYLINTYGFKKQEAQND
ncbi:AAA family ATPase [Colwelliaceae bacterium 6441]